MESSRISIAVIVPILNEARVLKKLIAQLVQQGFGEIILVDGGSKDGSATIADNELAKHAGKSSGLIIHSPRGRATQMNRGAAEAKAQVLLFLHADTFLPTQATHLINRALSNKRCWGHFNVRLNGKNILYRIIEFTMNLRSRISGIATGDQCIFVERKIFNRLGGYTTIPIMEDIEFSKRLKTLGRPARINDTVLTSTRRWSSRGIIRTILTMWTLRLLFWLRVKPSILARYYP
ncbi:MAG: glycosyltransferase family 2 protein [Gammaproteobacteria bacterium]|nr:glycosyltransferase family 2 protein [Gammaproteobacteria bacterium]